MLGGTWESTLGGAPGVTVQATVCLASVGCPQDDRIDKKTYLERCWPNSEAVRAYVIEKLFENGNKAFALYELETQVGDKFRNTEFIRTDEQRIMAIEVYFGTKAD